MRVAIQGCLHGQLDAVYAHIAKVESKLTENIDLLIICGDFQSIRHQPDLDDMHCPEKYKQMGTFQDYYDGKKQAGLLTVLIGGNHQAVNSLRQSHFGGWLAPRIYFLGQAGSIFVRKGQKKLRITGSSGIYNHSDFKYCTRVERYPLRGKERITAYHAKQVDAFRMQLLARICTMKQQKPEQYGQDYSHFDIMLSHDWPKDIALYGNKMELYKMKPYFQKEIEVGTLGSPPMLRLLQTAQPSYWFSAHMHVKYPAIYPHANNRFTHFLSLDKCLGQRSCLQLLYFDCKQQEMKSNEQKSNEIWIQVDPIWISVLQLTKDMMKGGDNLYYFDKGALKLVDINRMNNLIKQYPAIRSNMKQIGPYSFKEGVSQEEQTAHFANTIGLKLTDLEGICVEAGVKTGIVEVQDQIELEL